ncbi:hypothetical protein GCM10011588_03050 [Nocardia jinanensis]|uniref:Uncharacterized protein n=1 Tax=Nocardia jinanensis TaxID=382504 RepID=A0A917R6R5_9NOCA|nr:hypothetical protein GCM10011588_03050 [Nocardia jinanensis]
MIGRLHRPLLLSSAAMAGLVVVGLIAMVVDDRVLLGESVWLKPVKFGLAFLLYSLTLAWLLSLPHRGRRATWWLGVVFSVTAFVDVGFIVVQAARGTFSHFNTETDAVNEIGQKVFASGVPGLFLANLVIAVIVSIRPGADRPTVWAIRGGLAMAVVSMALGYLMGFTGTQLTRTADGRLVELAAGHTVVDAGTRQAVGAPDAVAGMPITHWSTLGGDLRIPHFVGLHGIQVVLAAVLVLAWCAARYPRLRPARTRSRLIGVVILGWGGLQAITFWQAMRGQSLAHPDTVTLLTVLGLGVLVTILAATALRSTPAPPVEPTAHPALQRDSAEVSATVRRPGRVRPEPR